MKILSFLNRHQVTDHVASDLLPLTPEYLNGHHQVYVDEIKAVLTGESKAIVKNIALTGGYGVGKSSILQKIATMYERQVVQVSLSTLGLSDEEGESGSSAGKATSTTNRIQKEIVKQLLYREDPSKTPGSRFTRIGTFKLGRGLYLAGLAALALTVFFYFVGWTAQLDELVTTHFDPGLWAHAGIFLALAVFVFALEHASHNRLRIEKLTTASATISLSDESATYFDQYLDEIIYFFEVTGRDIRIVEDIDRFDDPHIFETLRALNTLLNGAEQLNDKSIRFIYAIKDSIFDELGNRATGEIGGSANAEPNGTPVEKARDAAVQELARANRTKFFDLIIPVVPFISHLSARDLMIQTMRGIDHNVSKELINLTARHVTDMRLIKNIRNEFVIFRKLILRTNDGELGLNDNSLFAMILYKNIHLADFEAIKAGTSDLDRLYKDHRTLVTESTEDLRSEEQDHHQRLATLDSVGDRSEDLGNEVIEYIGRVARQNGVPDQVTQKVTFAGEPQSDDDLRSVSFWQSFIANNGGGVLSVSAPTYSYPWQLNISLSDAAKIVGAPLSLADWQESDRQKLRAELEEIGKRLDFLSHADMSDLMGSNQYQFESGESFEECAEKHLESALAIQLVTAGYINRNFTLYTSTYYTDLVSTRARNFIIHNVNPNVIDMHFELEPDDVTTVIQELGDSVLRERSMYNISVLDCLLETNVPHADTIVKHLTRSGAEEQKFLDAYLAGGNQQDALIRRLSKCWDGVFEFIANRKRLSDADQIKYFNAALKDTVQDIDYLPNKDVGNFVGEHYRELEVFTSNSTCAELASRAVALLAGSDARLESLSPLGDAIRQVIVDENRYRITRDNLVAALGGVEALSLDQIHDLHSAVYGYVVSHAPEYLAAIREKEPTSHTIESPDAFGQVISDIVERSAAALPDVLAAAAPDCQLLQLTDAPEAAWPALADAHRFPTSFENIAAYIRAIGELDERLANHLVTTTKIEESEAVDEADKINMAGHILAAREVLPDPTIRIDLVDSLQLENQLDPSQVQPETGALIGFLIERNFIEDDSESFALTSGTDWSTREFAISKSKQFSSFMTPTEIPAGDVPRLMKSTLVPERVKDELINHVDNFVSTDDGESLTAIAEYADSKQKRLAINLVTHMATAQIESQLVLSLLKPLLPDVSEPQLVEVLTQLAGKYAEVSERNGKRPKLASTEPNLALVETLEEMGIVSSHSVASNEITINMKKA